MARGFRSAVCTTLLVATVGLASAVGAASDGAGAADLTRLLPLGCANPAGHLSRHLLPARAGSARGQLTCFGEVLLRPHATSGPQGYGPRQIRAAYRLGHRSAQHRTVAVVDAYDDPNAESDLAVYRRTYGLPACTSTSGCLRKVNQVGRRSPLPEPDYGWAEEISLDLDAVSATCPDCRIVLVEANSPDTGPLMKAVDTAVRLGATAVSMSFGGGEDPTILAADRHLDHPGVAITASSGDDGYGVSWPASSRYVTAVGGTTLRRATNARGWSETAWSGAGSGCSRYEPKPTWQRDRGCAHRTVSDLSAVADPETGLAVFDTYNDCLITSICGDLVAAGAAQGLDGWAQVGGTSLSAPIVASIYAIAGHRHAAARAYALHGSLNDVRAGANGSCGSYLCRAQKGYDGPTGWGTPRGTAAF
jgi:hypothetical protein